MSGQANLYRCQHSRAVKNDHVRVLLHGKEYGSINEFEINLKSTGTQAVLRCSSWTNIH